MTLVSTDVLDAGLNLIRNSATLMVALPGAVASYAAAVASKLAQVAMAPADFAVGAAPDGGRQVSVVQKTNMPVATSGNAAFVALLDGPNNRLLYCGPVDEAADLIQGGTLTIGSFAIEIENPA